MGNYRGHIYAEAVQNRNMRAKRLGLEGLLAAVKRQPRPFDYVFTDETYRLSWNDAGLRKISRIFQRHGVEFYFVQQKMDSKTLYFEVLLATIEEQMNSRRIRTREGIRK
jgi:DNA invertase Pin-like site-specific DNA recombinase